MKRVLIISPHFPPINAPDMQRVRMSLPYYKDMGWGVPIVTTTAGRRGYLWRNGTLLYADTPEAMCEIMFKQTDSFERINKNAEQTRIVARNGYSAEELGEMIQKMFI